MSTPPIQLAFLKFLIEMNQSKKVLEIGTFIGNTTMHIAKLIGPQAHVVTIEKFDEFADLAQKNFTDNGFTSQIELLRGDAGALMSGLKDDYFDFIYVDGDKGKYLELTQIAEKKLSANGLILVDDVFFHGDALNEHSQTDKGQGCREVMEYYKDSKDFSKYLLPIYNGVLLLKRLPR
jgi:predicted O-methyltransferase YrrM